MRIYHDSNVLISLIKEEIGGQCRALFKEAEAFFQTAANQKYTIVISGLFLKEVEKKLGIGKSEILEKLGKLGAKNELLIAGFNAVRANNRVKGMHYSDRQHLAMAILEKCDCIVTFNIKDFEPVISRIQVFEPLDLA